MSSEKTMAVIIPPQLMQFLDLTEESTIEAYMQNGCLIIRAINEDDEMDIPSDNEYETHIIRTSMPVRIFYNEYKECDCE